MKIYASKTNFTDLDTILQDIKRSPNKRKLFSKLRKIKANAIFAYLLGMIDYAEMIGQPGDVVEFAYLYDYLLKTADLYDPKDAMFDIFERYENI